MSTMRQMRRIEEERAELLDMIESLKSRVEELNVRWQNLTIGL